MSDIDIIQTELTGDPLTRGYAGMTDQQATDDMLTVYRDGPIITSLQPAVIWNAVDETEYDLLSAEDKVMVDMIGCMGAADIPVGAGLIKDKIFGMFDGGTASRNAIIALTVSPLITRAAEIGVPNLKVGQVEEARR